MFKYKLPYLSDGIFVFITSFFLSFTIFNFYIGIRWAAIILSLDLTVAITMLYAFNAKKKYGKLTIKFSDRKKAENLLDFLCLSSDEIIAKKISEHLKNNDFEVIYTEKYKIRCKDKTIFYVFKYDDVSKQDIADVFKSKDRDEQIELWCVKISDEAMKFAEKIFGKHIKIVDFKMIFQMFYTDKIQPLTLPQTKDKKAFLLSLKQSFDRKKSKGYAVYGVALLAMSYFVFSPLWYIISGSLFVIYALIVRFFAPSDKELNQNLYV